MIVNHLHIVDIFVLKAKNYTPVALHSHRPIILAVSLELVQPIVVRAQLFGRLCSIKQTQNNFHFVSQIGSNQTTVSILIETLKSLMSKVFYRQPYTFQTVTQTVNTNRNVSTNTCQERCGKRKKSQINYPWPVYYQF